MVDSADAIANNKDLERSLEKGGVPRAKRKVIFTPSYQVIGTDSKIPVSSSHGKLWKSRMQAAMAKRVNNNELESWHEAVKYYKHDQLDFRAEGADVSGNEPISRKYGRHFRETENIVFANTSALVPAIYSKNPNIEVTVVNDKSKDLALVSERLINVLLSKRASPGVNLKPKARRSVVSTALKNIAYIETGYTFKKDSSQQAVEEMTQLAADLQNAKTPQEVEKVEGKLTAMEEKIDLLRPSGPWCKFRRPEQILRDSDSESEELSDCKWIMIWEYVATSWLEAVFFDDSKGNCAKSIYKPTHVLNASSDGRNDAEGEIDTFTLLGDDNQATGSEYGYDDEVSYKKAQRTKVYYVWDKVTRRIYMYNSGDWTWPIWVWDDYLHFDTFFPLSQLVFYADPEEGIAKGEVVYYLDQQDAINEINSEFRFARQQAKNNIVYDKNRGNKEDVEKLIKGDEAVAVGIDVPEGYTLKDTIQSILPPSMQYAELFDKRTQYDAIDRISSITGVMRGSEFKTNTTNQAINQYTNSTQNRLDEKIDAIEDYIGDIGWKILQLCIQFMDREQVIALIGERGAAWVNMNPQDIQANVQMRVLGGSSIKPTSQIKKQMALEVGQVLGQFVNAAPQAVTSIMLKVFSTAFEEIVITEEDWTSIAQSIAQPAQQSGQSTSQDGKGDNIEQVISKLPPDAQQAVQQAIQKGVPPDVAVQKVIGMLQGGQEPPQQ